MAMLDRNQAIIFDSTIRIKLLVYMDRRNTNLILKILPWQTASLLKLEIDQCATLKNLNA